MNNQRKSYTRKRDAKMMKNERISSQNGGQNPSKSVSGGVLGGSWGHLGSKLRFGAYLGANFGGSWADLGSKMGVLGSILAPKWGPKSMKILPKSDPKGDHFFNHFLDRLLKRFGANLAPTWLPKPAQNGAKLVPKSMQVGVLI